MCDRILKKKEVTIMLFEFTDVKSEYNTEMMDLWRELYNRFVVKDDNHLCKLDEDKKERFLRVSLDVFKRMRDGQKVKINVEELKQLEKKSVEDYCLLFIETYDKAIKAEKEKGQNNSQLK